MSDCSEFAYSILHNHEDFNNCFMLSIIVNSVQKAESKDTDTCISFTNHEEKSFFNCYMAIVHTVSKTVL